MKTLAYLSKTLPVILISVIFLTCDIVPSDDCDGTIAPEISVGVKADIHLRDKNNLKIKDQRIKVEIFKTPCGAAKKGEFIFEGLTDSEGNFYSTVANYSLRNKNDKVTVSAIGLDIVRVTNYEDFDIKYDGFIDGTIRTVDITLYID